MTRARTMSLVALAAALMAVPGVASAQTQTFQVQDRGSRIGFVSDATLETINGTSGDVRGEITVDPSDLSTARARIVVPVASLRTGNDLRDEHLRSDSWLDSSRHPEAVFEITGVRGASSLQPNRAASLRVTGRFTIHGVTRNVTARVRAKWDGEDGLTIRARFSVDLEDYNVSVPAIVRLKVSNTIQISVSIQARTS